MSRSFQDPEDEKISQRQPYIKTKKAARYKWDTKPAEVSRNKTHDLGQQLELLISLRATIVTLSWYRFQKIEVRSLAGQGRSAPPLNDVYGRT